MLFCAKDSPCLFSGVAILQPQSFLGHHSIAASPWCCSLPEYLWSCPDDLLYPLVRLDITTCGKRTVLLKSQRASEVLNIYKAGVGYYALSILFNDIFSGWLVLDSELAEYLSRRARQRQGRFPVQLSHFINKSTWVHASEMTCSRSHY